MNNLRWLLALLQCSLFFSKASAQFKPEIEIGSIAWLTYVNSQSENSPLTENDGNGTFENKWLILLGAQINERFSMYAEVQTRNGLNLVTYGLSVIYRPESLNYINFELGKFLAPFGTFLSRKWPSENPLTDWPLIYDYRTGLSAFDLPQNESELLNVRGQGQSFQYGVTILNKEQLDNPRSNTIVAIPGSGLRILSRQVYLTGIQIFGQSNKFSYNFGVTNGALSNPVDINNSTAVQLLGRLKYSPLFGLDIGASFAWGAYLDKNSVDAQLDAIGEDTEDFRQTIIGIDLSYSIGHLIFFTEFLHNRWESPFIGKDLDELAFDAELKYRLFTRFYLAGRFSRIDFQDIPDPQDVDGDGRFRESWDYDVDQLELGIGYHLNRNALLKLLVVFNTTHGVPGGDPADDLLAVQTVVSF